MSNKLDEIKTMLELLAADTKLTARELMPEDFEGHAFNDATLKVCELVLNHLNQGA